MSEDGTVLFSAAHKRRFAQLLERRSKLSQAGKKGMASRWNNANEDITPNKEVITQDSKEKETKVKESKGKKIEYPYQDIVALWNSICSSLPKIKSLNDNRRNKIRLRLAAVGSPSVRSYSRGFRRRNSSAEETTQAGRHRSTGFSRTRKIG